MITEGDMKVTDSIDLKDEKPVTIQSLGNTIYIYKGSRLITRFLYGQNLIDNLQRTLDIVAVRESKD